MASLGFPEMVVRIIWVVAGAFVAPSTLNQMPRDDDAIQKGRMLD